MRGLMIAAAALAATPALAQTPSLRSTFTPVEGQPLDRVAVIGPMGMGTSDRWGSMSSSLDYGSLSIATNQRLVSLGDLGYTTGATNIAVMRDSISLRAPRQFVRFTFEVTPRVSARATGFGLTRATVDHGFALAFVDILGAEARFRADHFMDDRPSGAPTLVSNTRLSSAFAPLDGSAGVLELLSGSGAVNKRTRYALTLPMYASSAVDMRAVGFCQVQLVAQRALDAGTVACGTNFRWIGATGLNGAPIRLDSLSGQDWTRTYRAPGGRMASSIAEFDGIGARSVVPEPGTWAMLILGFGIIGVAARRRKAAPA